MIAQDSLARSGLEIYKTKDSNVEKVSDEEDKEGLVLQNGTIIEINYFDEMFSNSFDYDYEDISSNGSVKLPSVDDTIFYKGKKILLKKEWNPHKWEDLKNCLLGFITEQKYSEDGVEIKISGMSKLLDQKKEFSFTKTKRSKILKNIIESAGLKANINTKGLKDEKINYTNVSSSGTSFNGSEQVNSLVQRAIGNETDDYKKMELINKEVNNVLTYSNYPCSKCSTPEEVLSKKKG